MVSQTEKQNYDYLKDCVLKSGAQYHGSLGTSYHEKPGISYRALRGTQHFAGLSTQFFGVCGLDISKENFVDLSPELTCGLNYAISVGVRLSDRILEDIKDHPTKLYFYHYRQINYLLDRIALLITGLIQEKGYEAVPIPSSQTIDWEKQRGHLSHKEIARRAGLGWIGRNNLLVNPVFGSRIRLVTILTNLPLSVDKPIKDNCDNCIVCIKSCPAGAIKERQKDFDHKACFKQLDIFRKKYGIGHHICGICVKVCKGKRNLKK